MKQMQGITVRSGFSMEVTKQVAEGISNRWLALARRQLIRLADSRRELIGTVAATAAIGIGVLLASYLFFTQLAAYGW
jgi:hypothetical protein